MKKYITTTITILLTLLLSVAAPSIAFAESDIKQATEPVQKSVNTLVTILDDDTLSAVEKETQELAARKQVLKDALTLSIAETKELLANLKGLPAFEKESKESGMQSAFIGALQSYASYYEQQLKKVDDLGSTDEVKSLAQEIKTYRETIHNPNVQQVVDFVLLFHNRDIITIAATRHGKIVSDIRKLENKGLIDEGMFDRSLTEADTYIDEADDLNKSAKEMMFSIKEEQPIDTTALEENVIEEAKEEPTVRDTILKSFDDIKSAYAIFLTISREVRSILGLD